MVVGVAMFEASLAEVKVCTHLTVVAWAFNGHCAASIALVSWVNSRNHFHLSNETSPVALLWKIHTNVSSIATDGPHSANTFMGNRPPFVLGSHNCSLHMNFVTNFECRGVCRCF